MTIIPGESGAGNELTAPSPAGATEKTPMPGARFYRPELDALRFFAFLLVYIHHIFPFTPDSYRGQLPDALAQIAARVAWGAGIGLPLFFMLSAYLITTLMLLEHQRTDGLNVRAFYARRILRIWPLYFLGLAIGALIAWRRHDGADMWMFSHYAAFMGDFWFTSHPQSYNPMAPLWSISVEEKFYLLAPLLILANRRLLWVGAAMMLISLGFIEWRAAAPADFGMTLMIWGHPLAQMIHFGAGVALAALTWNREPPSPRLGLRIGAIVLAAVLAGIGVELGYVSPLAATAGTAALCGACVLAMLAVMGLRAPPPLLVYLGKISFGLYVFHMVVVEAVARLAHSPSVAFRILALGPLVAVAALSYRYLERPFLRVRDRFSFVSNRPA